VYNSDGMKIVSIRADNMIVNENDIRLRGRFTDIAVIPRNFIVVVTND
jgi:hypothetical protein